MIVLSITESATFARTAEPIRRWYGKFLDFVVSISVTTQTRSVVHNFLNIAAPGYRDLHAPLSFEPDTFGDAEERTNLVEV